ncbi:unnamed protein product [Adineta steineri]|uniref:Uncharacterized protein n=1 Tax=Adineta steineri TaxID=433720 RepID=A0A818TVH8_9BILA|nr:unnamed protein product [Adineta steineri]CAF3690163.1 unnamed protein product [Adineta steineri]
MSLCLIVHGGLILHHPNLYDEDVLAYLDANGLLNNENENSNRIERPRAINYQPSMPSIYDDSFIRQLINHQKNAKRSKLNLHTNLNLPRYLRALD